ncbi:MAG: alpha/beta fold hydrolase [Hyphomicrobiaceae bacterium]
MTKSIWHDGKIDHLKLADVKIEAGCFGPPPGEAMTIILLHEGLGCLEMWRDFPRRLVSATGCGVFAYSRQGYGNSDACKLPRPIDYMEREAQEILPRLIDAINIHRCVLFGHSDGGTIAGLYPSMRQDHRVRGLILVAPHFFAEECARASIANICQSYREGDLRQKLIRYHGTNVDCAFLGWSETWLDPRFVNWDVRDAIGFVRVPILFIQGDADPYGSVAQAEAVVAESYAPVDVQILQSCGHAPHVERPEFTLAVVSSFIERLQRVEATTN